jgi:hypothetical protein
MLLPLVEGVALPLAPPMFGQSPFAGAFADDPGEPDDADGVVVGVGLAALAIPAAPRLRPMTPATAPAAKTIRVRVMCVHLDTGHRDPHL